jgi:hypothetical protein
MNDLFIYVEMLESKLLRSIHSHLSHITWFYRNSAFVSLHATLSHRTWIANGFSSFQLSQKRSKRLRLHFLKIFLRTKNFFLIHLLYAKSIFNSVEWWDAAMKWKTRKNFWSRDSASSDFHMYLRNDLIFCRYATTQLWSIALKSIRIVNLLISKWSRFATQWRADFLILRRWSWDQASQTRSYEDDRWVKHSRHDRVEDDRARRALNEKVKLSWKRRSRSQMNLDRWAHRWVFESWNFYIMRWIFYLDLADRDSNSFFSSINKIRQL